MYEVHKSMRVLPPAELVKIGELLYGAHWKTEMARHLGVNRLTIIRWVQGAHPVPEEAVEAVYRLAWEKYKELEKLFSAEML